MKGVSLHWARSQLHFPLMVKRLCEAVWEYKGVHVDTLVYWATMLSIPKKHMMPVTDSLYTVNHLSSSFPKEKYALSELPTLAGLCVGVTIAMSSTETAAFLDRLTWLDGLDPSVRSPRTRTLDSSGSLFQGEQDENRVAEVSEASCDEGSHCFQLNESGADPWAPTGAAREDPTSASQGAHPDVTWCHKWKVELVARKLCVFCMFAFPKPLYGCSSNEDHDSKMYSAWCGPAYAIRNDYWSSSRKAGTKLIKLWFFISSNN